MNQYLIFSISSNTYAIPIDWVDRSILAVAIRQVEGHHPHLLGIIDIAGEITGVVSFRRLLGLEDKEIEVSDNLLVCQINKTRLALLVDSVICAEYCEIAQTNEAIEEGAKCPVDHFIRFNESLVPVFAFEKLLSQDVLAGVGGTDG
ncbi:MAG: hypothetical protein S4CHLAM102_10700 [Chlamydiia bacterium]|nr:hypothetical protein [Chlamydiia bacterium]